MARVSPPRPAALPQPTPRELLLHSWPGRVFVIAAMVKLVVALWRFAAAPPAIVAAASSIATIGLVAALAAFVWRLFVQVQRQLLWRVRRKLILSYIFIGVI